MLTVNQLKQHYLKDLFSYRQLDSFLYKKTKTARGYVIGVVNSFKITDQGFWNNDNLLNQFEIKNTSSSGSRFFDSIIDDVMDNETKKQIEKAAEESSGKLVFYAKEDDNSIYADLIFFNQSKNRNLDEALIALDGIPAKFRLKTYSAHSGNHSFEDVISFEIGSFSFFKESVLGKECEIYFNHKPDENDETKDFLGLKFKIKLPLVDVAAVDYLVNGDQWDANFRENLIPAIEKGLDLSNEQTQLDGVENSILKSKKRAKIISWVTAVLLFFIAANIWEDILEGGIAFLFLLGIIAIGMSGKYIGRILNKNKEKKLRDKLSSLSVRKSELESQIKKYYLIKN